MTREQLESEISRLAVEETKIIEIQKRLKRKSSAWIALEVKRIEHSAYLAVYSIQLADMMSTGQRHAKLYGIEYSSSTDPQDIIDAGLRKSGIRSDNSEPSKISVVANGCAKLIVIGIVILIGISIIAVIVDNIDNNNSPGTSFVPTGPNRPAKEHVTMEDAQSMVFDHDAKAFIGYYVRTNRLSSSQLPTFVRHLRTIQEHYPDWDDVRQVKHAIVRTTGKPFQPY